MTNRSSAIDFEARVEHALARSVVYRTVSELALYPDAADPRSGFKDPDERRAGLQIACSALARAGYDPTLLRALRELDAMFSGESDEAWVREYVRVFGHTISKECPPYETEYGAPHLFEQTQALADLAGFYRAFGLEVRSGAGERLDHLGIELEFMHVLTYKEAYALEHHTLSRADLCREAQEKFLCEHLGTWIDDFSARLAQRAKEGPYVAYAATLGRFMAAELTYLAVSPVQRKKLKPQAGPLGTPACGVRCGLARSPSNPEAG